mmetsp:Transcript_91041/g.152487  ORF Transcript_91041/g.152487 Transcript_91041/m.152487 type:complete len:242 (-) Transcript_91041:517-1242(-)
MLRNPLRMVRKIRRREVSASVGKHSRWNLEDRRGVSSFLPPPGGPHAATTMRSWISFQKIFLRSYKPPWSMTCRRSSTGGDAPYSSRAGMLMSSTKNTSCFPGGAPRTAFPRFLLSLLSRRSCKFLLLVCALKVMSNVRYSESAESLLRPSSRNDEMTCDLPTPVGPLIMMLRRTVIRFRRNVVKTVVSEVGTRIEKYGSSRWYTNLGILYVQGTHDMDFLWMHQSYTDPSSGNSGEIFTK